MSCGRCATVDCVCTAARAAAGATSRRRRRRSGRRSRLAKQRGPRNSSSDDMHAVHVAHRFHPHNIVNVGMIHDRNAPTGLILRGVYNRFALSKAQRRRRLVKRTKLLSVATAQQCAAVQNVLPVQIPFKSIEKIRNIHPTLEKLLAPVAHKRLQSSHIRCAIAAAALSRHTRTKPRLR